MDKFRTRLISVVVVSSSVLLVVGYATRQSQAQETKFTVSRDGVTYSIQSSEPVDPDDVRAIRQLLEKQQLQREERQARLRQFLEFDDEQPIELPEPPAWLRAARERAKKAQD